MDVLWTALYATGEFVWDNLPQIIDILVVAALLYYLFVYVRGTKTAIVLQGIIILALVYFLCQYFKLITLVFILEKILVVGPLALFIIFVPEIRKVLEQAGKRSRLIEWFVPREHQQVESSVVQVVAGTASELARRRVGALFVMEREERVEEFLVPGTELQALPSPRLLASLFDKHNPLHDGAVVFRQDRLHSAGNFLPISESVSLGSDLGTRHRGAVGLTERCDAVVVVVSEERGELSLAVHGRLARGLSERQFVEQLTALVEPNENFTSVMPREAFI